MTRKEHATEKREAKIREWMVFFTREYQLNRAYKVPVKVSIDRAIKEVKNAIARDWKKTPSERSFIVDVKLEVFSADRIKAEVARIEAEAAK